MKAMLYRFDSTNLICTFSSNLIRRKEVTRRRNRGLKAPTCSATTHCMRRDEWTCCCSHLNIPTTIRHHHPFFSSSQQQSVWYNNSFVTAKELSKNYSPAVSVTPFSLFVHCLLLRRHRHPSPILPISLSSFCENILWFSSRWLVVVRSCYICISVLISGHFIFASLFLVFCCLFTYFNWTLSANKQLSLVLKYPQILEIRKAGLFRCSTGLSLLQ